MGSSSNFGNMFSMAGAALFLPFLPMLPIQILLNNLLYDVSEIAIPFDSVDPEAIAAAGAMGHQADRALHAGVRAGQFDLRLPDLLRPAASVSAPARSCSRPAGSSNRSPPRCWWSSPSAPGGRSSAASRVAFWSAWRSASVAVAIALPLCRSAAGLASCAAAAVLRLSGRRDGCLSGARRNRQRCFLSFHRRPVKDLRLGPRWPMRRRSIA